MLSKQDINRENLLQLLMSEEFIKVMFTKSTTNTVRTMLCSLRTEYVPIRFEKSIKATLANKNEDILPVWDIIKGEWRSFKISSIISVEKASELNRINEIANRIKKR